MSFHWPFLHWSASTVARDHVASAALLEFHRYVPGVKKDATITASCLKNSGELKKKHGKNMKKNKPRVILLCQRESVPSESWTQQDQTRFFRAPAKDLGHAMCNDVDKSTKKCKTCDFHVEMDRILRWKSRIQNNKDHHRHGWWIHGLCSMTIVKLEKKSSKIKSHLLESTGERSPFACELRLNLHAETGAC